MDPNLKKKEHTDPKQKRRFKVADGIMNKDQLLSLTLRQLRQQASKLSVPLYSRKHNLFAPNDCALSRSASEICQKT